MKNGYDIVGLGLCVIDLVGLGATYPEEDNKIQLDECDWQAGGSAATGIVTAARLGAKAGFIGQLGLDYFGQRTLESLKKEKIDTSSVRVYHDVLSQFAFSYSSRDTGRRTTFFNFNHHWNTYKLDDDARALIRSAKVLVLDRHEDQAGLEAVRIAGETGIPCVYDPSTQVSSYMEELLSIVSHPVVPIGFVKNYSDEIDLVRGAKKILQLGPEAVVVTCGDKGSLLVTQKNDQFFPAFKVKVVDTLGAGDVFHGAFAYALFRRWSLDKVCIFANAVAAIKCRHLGGRRGIPNLRQVSGFLQHRGYKFV